VMKKVKVVGFHPTPDQFFEKNWTKNFGTKVFEVLRNFFQKVPKWGLGQRPKIKKTFSSGWDLRSKSTLIFHFSFLILHSTSILSQTSK